MRMWLIPPRRMCTRHLETELADVRRLARRIACRKSLGPFLAKRWIEVHSANRRYDAIARELRRRGSAIPLPELPPLNIEVGSVDKAQSLRDLTSKCDDCRHRLRYLLIGQASAKARSRLETYSFRRMIELSGLWAEEFLYHFDHVNLIPRWHGKQGKGDMFEMSEAREFAESMLPDLKHECVVLLGKRVATAFRVNVDYFEEFQLGPSRAIVFPHPSGINRWWNSLQNQQHASTFVADCVRRQLRSSSHPWTF